MTNPWQECAVGPIRREALRDSRIVACFAERPRSLHAMLARAVARRPEHEALIVEALHWSYRELDAEVMRVAAGFAALGVGRGDRVAMLLRNRPEFVSVLFALQRLGAIAVPIGVREQRPGLTWMIAQCGACAIVFDAELADRLPDAADAPALRSRIAVGADGSLPAGCFDLDRLSDRKMPAPPPAEVDEHDTAVILYTSGTTGHPKGAMLTHFNIAHSVLHFEACMALGPADRGALAVPASHVTGLIATIATFVHVAGTIVMLADFKAADFLALVEREHVTHTLMVPAMYKLCLMTPGFAEHDLGSWRVGGYGGAPMPVATIDALARRLPRLGLVNAYGATETTSPTTMMPPGRTRVHADTVGVPLPCAEVLVMDDDGREVARGQPGELWIAGPMVVPGYWDDAAATASAFSGGYWRSGDLGSIDAAGHVRILDRKKDMLNRGGFKIYSVEVENALMSHPGVLEAAIVARACPVLGERVHAFIHAPGLARDDRTVRAHCAQQLPDYKVPETFTWTDTPLPRNANGKVLKRELRDALGEPPDAEHPPLAPSSSVGSSPASSFAILRTSP